MLKLISAHPSNFEDEAPIRNAQWSKQNVAESFNVWHKLSLNTYLN